MGEEHSTALADAHELQWWRHMRTKFTHDGFPLRVGQPLFGRAFRLVEVRGNQPPDLAAENERLRAALKKIAAEDYRGPRPWGATVAEQALRDA